MPIVSTYRSSAIQPGIVQFHGVVVMMGGQLIDPGRSFTPGVTVVRNAVGRYSLAFNDGVAVGFTSIVLTSIVGDSGDDPYLFTLQGVAGTAPGASIMFLEVSDIAGTLTDPLNSEGFMYLMTRLNSSISVT